MDLSVITTYRCDSRCSMCFIWKNPTHPEHELDLATLDKLPGGFDYLNITGGEPTLRKDLLEICHLLYPKTGTLEISTNGLHADVLERIVDAYPDIKIRISVEGFEATNDRIRGEKNGFKKKVGAMERLIAAGGTTSASLRRFRTRTSKRSSTSTVFPKAWESSSQPPPCTTRSSSTRTTT